MKHLNERETVAEWYATQVFTTCSTPISEVEWMIQNLNDSAYAEIEEFYQDQMSNLEAEGFLK